MDLRCGSCSFQSRAGGSGSQVEELLEDAAEFEAQPLPGELPGDEDEDADHNNQGRLRSMHYALRREPEVDYSDQLA